MTPTLKIVATALLATTLAGAAWAQSDSTTEADCPEDMDTEAGCDMSGAESSEAGPIEGAATAPVAPESGADSVTTMSEPDADPEASTDSAAATTQESGDTGSTDTAAASESTEPDCPEDFDTEPGCDMSGAASSESGPVEGAATAPVAPEGEGTDEAVTTMQEPDSDPESDSATATGSEGATDATASAAASGEAQSHEVGTRGVQFDPMFVYVQPGDTVNWTGMASHNVETIDGMVPEGQEKVNSELGENISVTFDTVGIVAYKCTPHWGNRMGGMIVVGDPEDPGAIIDAYMQSAEENPENLPALGLLKKLRADMEEKGMIQG